jgi:hypothetical protein
MVLDISTQTPCVCDYVESDMGPTKVLDHSQGNKK